MLFYTLRTQNYLFLMDNLLNPVKRIISEEDLFEHKDSGLDITYSYLIFKVKLYAFIPIWHATRNEELVIQRGEKKFILKGFLARYAVKKHISADFLLQKYGSQLSTEKIVSISGPKRIVLNILYFINAFGVFSALLSLLSLTTILARRQWQQLPSYIVMLTISFLILTSLILYRKSYHKKLDQILT